MIIYENQVKSMGNFVKEFGDETVIFFGDGAPETLADYSYIIDIKPMQDNFKVGDIVNIDESEFEIIAVGDIAKKNLENLGHLTINFTGNKNTVLPGSIVVISKQTPEIKIGSKIKVIRK